ncbi:GNAT family N-acetyltransferase [Novosphingobium sp. ZN18A2]|uniref:GNAT family N-acetyltransferase n=1 Tax=Novosphingobium sp. ZN18A2 TaxID=3079861 RepID=UPI0030D3622A
MKRLARRLANRIVSDYRINWIVARADPSVRTQLQPGQAISPVDDAIAALLACSDTAKVRNALTYRDAGLGGFAIGRDGRPQAVIHYADAAQYTRDATWPLKANEIAIMDVVTEEADRGKGLAVTLIDHTTARYLENGAARAVAFVWWSNKPSLRAFRKAGWHRIGLSLEWEFRGQWRHLHLARAFALPDKHLRYRGAEVGAETI